MSSKPTTTDPTLTQQPQNPYEPAYSPHPPDILPTVDHYNHEPAYTSSPPNVELINTTHQPAYDPNKSYTVNNNRPHSTDNNRSTRSHSNHSIHSAEEPVDNQHPTTTTNNSSSDAHSIGISTTEQHDEQQPRVIIKDGGEISTPRTQQIVYPILYLLVATCFVIMALIPRWENQSIVKYKAIRPIMLTAMTLAGILFITSLIHTILLLVTGRSRWAWSKKTSTPAKVAFYVFNLITTGIASALLLAVILIMVFNFNQFHKVLNTLSAVTFWCSLIISTPILVWLNIRCFYDFIQVLRRPPQHVK